MPKPEVMVAGPHRRKRYGDESRKLECNLRPCAMDPGPRLLAVFGTPCGGTTYVTQAAHHAGLDVGQEHMHAEGTVSGWLLWSWKRTQLDEFEFAVEARVIRHPLKVLETLPMFSHRPRYNTSETPIPWWHDDPLVAALRFWVLTHEHPRLDDALLLRPGTVHFEEDWGILLAAVERAEPGRKLRRDLPAGLFRRSKRRRWHRRTWEQLEQLDPEYTQRAKDLTLKFFGTLEIEGTNGKD